MKAAVQILQQAEELKNKLCGKDDVFGNNEAWTYHHELQRVYGKILLVDLEFALDKKVEQDLWNLVFKNQITLLQSQSRNDKNPKRSEISSVLSWFLESASGFYFQLLQELCATFELDLPICRKGSLYGLLVQVPDHEGVVQPHKSSCYYICQHILVHLGDIARYRSQPRQAESFYRQAVLIVPSSGHPYNQLALLEAGKGDKLSSVYYYVRSIAARNPFPVAHANLQQILSRVINQNNMEYPIGSRLTNQEFISAFLQFIAIVHAGVGLNAAKNLVFVLGEALTALLATDAITSWKLIQMIVVTLFMYYDSLSRCQDKAEGEECVLLHAEDETVVGICSDFLACTLNSLLLPVYTRKDDDNLEHYTALPAVKVILDWVHGDISVLGAAGFTSRPQIWPSLCKLLNALQSSCTDHLLLTEYLDSALPEDRDLQGFVPLQKILKAFRTKELQTQIPEDIIPALRSARMVAVGRWIAAQEVNGKKIMTYIEKTGAEKIEDVALKPGENGKIKQHIFEPVSHQEPTHAELKHLETMGRDTESTARHGTGDTARHGTGDTARGILNITVSEIKEAEATVSPEAKKVEPKSSPETCRLSAEAREEKMQSLKCMDKVELELAASQKRPGILKPGNSTTTSEASPVLVLKDELKTPRILSSSRKTRQNVALQTIMKKTMNLTIEPEPSKQTHGKSQSDLKQVTFKTPSPSISPCSSAGSQTDSRVSPGSNQQRVVLANRQSRLTPTAPRLYPTPGIIQTQQQQATARFNENIQTTAPPPAAPPISLAFPPPPAWWSDGTDGAPKQEPSHNPFLTTTTASLFNSCTVPAHSLFSSAKPTYTSSSPLTQLVNQQVGVMMNTPPTLQSPPWFNPSVPPPPVGKLPYTTPQNNLTDLLTQLQVQRTAQQQEVGAPPSHQFVSSQLPPVFPQALLSTGSQFPSTNYPPKPADPGTQQHQFTNNVASVETQENFNANFPALDTVVEPAANTYSLFSTPSWTAGLSPSNNIQQHVQQQQPNSTLQSLWSGPGPSPLERLLEQQKLKKEHNGLPNS